MHLCVTEFVFFCVVLCLWCNGQSIPEDLQKYNITPPNMFGRESPTNKTMDQLIMEAMGGLKGDLNLKTLNGGILMEMDMLLSKQQYYSLYEQPHSSTLIRRKRKAIRNPSRRWTNGEIPYLFKPGVFSLAEQNMVEQAMLEWERYTCLRFRQATFSDQNYIVFCNNGGYYSHLGMVGGRQVISLSSAGCINNRTILHEIGHAIGLVHEHQLPNRDDYVEILTENVQPDRLMEFTKYTLEDVDQMNVPYDYSSIMHFGDTAYSKDGVSKTIRVINPEKEVIIGKVAMLSFIDVKVVNKMYQCTAGCQNKHNNLVECDRWAKAGECEAYPQWMIRNCQKSCRACDKPITIQAPTKTPTTDIEHGIHIWMISVIALTLTVIVILVAVIIAMKRRVARNEYAVAVNRVELDRQSHGYMDLNGYVDLNLTSLP